MFLIPILPTTINIIFELGANLGIENPNIEFRGQLDLGVKTEAFIAHISKLSSSALEILAYTLYIGLHLTHR
jgi:hypothetical protein